jgi:hypothetical protein
MWLLLPVDVSESDPGSLIACPDPVRCETSSVRGTRRAVFDGVAFLERRKGDAHRTLDRRRTYIDVIERVLGSCLPSEIVRHPSIFTRLEFGQSVVGSTVSEVQIDFLDDNGPSKRH